MFCILFVLLNLLAAVERSDVLVHAAEVVVGKELVIDLPKKSGYYWALADEDFKTAGLVSYVSDYVDRSRPEFHRFVFQAEKSGYTNITFTVVPLGEVNPLVFYFPTRYEVHVVEKPDTGMIAPPVLPDTGMIMVNSLEVVVGKELVIDLPKKSGYYWALADEDFKAAGLVSYVSDYVDRSRPEFHRFVFQAEKSGYTTISFTVVPLGEVNPLVFYFPTRYEVHVVEKPDTGMIAPPVLPDTGMIKVNNALEVGVGDELVIDLDENPSTGYIWSLFDESFGVDGFLSYVSDFRIEKDGSDDKRVGKSLIHRFVFRGEKCGFATVLFSIARLGKDLPTRYEVHVVEKPDTGMIAPPVLPDTGMIMVNGLEVVVGKELVIDLPKKSGYYWTLADEDFKAAGLVSYVSDYVDRSRPEFHRFVFQAEKSGYTTISFTVVPLGEVNPLVFYFPTRYEVHVVEKPDTGMIGPY